MVIARGCGRGNWELFNVYTVSVLQDEKISGDWFHSINVIITSELYT